MRVAFTLIGGRTWTGGANYLFNLLSQCINQQPGRISPILFVAEDAAEADYSKFMALDHVEVIKTPLLNEDRKRRALFSAVFQGRDAAISDLFRQYEIDVVFESARYFGWRLPYPAVAWIPDFQHRKLPQFFSKASWWKREIGFRLQIWGGRTIMVSSEDAKNDCLAYYPSTRSRIGVVHFAIPPVVNIHPERIRNTVSKYGLPDVFLFMPNQFWKHKNHLKVIEALSLLNERGIRATVAASGLQSDPRDPDHMPHVLEQIEKMAVKDQFRLLGMIPYPDLVDLMFASAAVLNPSFSEGWSTTVEEAKSMGKRMLVSNLAVHQEQLGQQATYFDPNSANEIADAIENLRPATDQEKVEALALGAARANEAVSEFVTDFCNLIESAGQAK